MTSGCRECAIARALSCSLRIKQLATRHTAPGPAPTLACRHTTTLAELRLLIRLADYFLRNSSKVASNVPASTICACPTHGSAYTGVKRCRTLMACGVAHTCLRAHLLNVFKITNVCGCSILVSSEDLRVRPLLTDFPQEFPPRHICFLPCICVHLFEGV